MQTELLGTLRNCCRARSTGGSHIKGRDSNLTIGKYEAQFHKERGNQEILSKD